jgi:hypothetical protein
MLRTRQRLSFTYRTDLHSLPENLQNAGKEENAAVIVTRAVVTAEMQTLFHADTLQ